MRFWEESSPTWLNLKLQIPKELAVALLRRKTSKPPKFEGIEGGLAFWEGKEEKVSNQYQRKNSSKAQGSRSFTVHFRRRPPLWSPEKKGDGGENTKACETEIGLDWGRENANRDCEGEAAPVAAWSAVLRRLWRRGLRREERNRNQRWGRREFSIYSKGKGCVWLSEIKGLYDNL